MDIIDQYARRKARAHDMAAYIRSLKTPELHKLKSAELQKLYSEVHQCASYLVFNEYFTVDDLKLVKAHTCKKHLLCPFCAMRRSGKFVSRNVPKVEQVMAENPSLIPAMVTLTIKNTPDLTKGFIALRNAHRRLSKARRNSLQGQKFTEWAKVAGGITSYEFTRNENGDWHPHIHAMVLLNDYIDQPKLSAEWKQITGDSFIVDVRKIRRSLSAGGVDLASGMLEVCKYALKFHDLSLEDTWLAYQTLKTRRLVDSFGVLRGVDMPDNLLDDPLEGLPYVERHYQYRPYRKAYDLTLIRGSGLGAGEGAECS